MGTENVISVKSGIHYKHTQIWRHTLFMGYEMNNLSRNLEINENYFVKRHSPKDIVVRRDGKNIFQLLRNMTRKYLPLAF